MASIRLQEITKVFPNRAVAVENVNLEIADGELVVLVGPSGCGKSTTLRIIAGLESATAGRVFIGDDDVTALPPQRRDLAMVFQNYALYPHKTVRQNLEFGLKLRRTAAAVIKDRVNKAAAVLGLEEMLERRPSQLSGGQRQRVALGRAMVREPKAFLLDEPLSNLDAQLRVQTRAELSRMHRRLGATMVYVTHDQEEAMTLGDRVVVMREGKVQQAAAPLQIYRRPANIFVAGFIGSPAMNFFRGTVENKGGPPQLRAQHFSLALPGEFAATSAVVLGVRPHDIRIAETSADVETRVEVVQPLGSDLLVHVAPRARGSDLITLIVPADSQLAVGDLVPLHFQRDKLHLFNADTERRF